MDRLDALKAELLGAYEVQAGRIHTPRDTAFENDNLRCLLEAMKQGI